MLNNVRVMRTSNLEQIISGACRLGNFKKHNIQIDETVATVRNRQASPLGISMGISILHRMGRPRLSRSFWIGPFERVHPFSLYYRVNEVQH